MKSFRQMNCGRKFGIHLRYIFIAFEILTVAPVKVIELGLLQNLVLNVGAFANFQSIDKVNISY